MRNLLNLIVTSLLAAGLASAQLPAKEKVVAGAERAFEKAAKTNPLPAPGCAVGVSLNGESVFEKAFGMAEMEHSVPNTPQTIFESGSVAKQFTAAALVLLQLDGKLKIDDDVRKYIPELPQYDKPITIRHLLNHTAGLRDWGSVMALTGAGRGDRVVTQAIALDVIYRQKHLDFTPGAEYSYSNSGYQLAAEIVERVSKQKFSTFIEERIFKPLGMTNSSWREDFQQIVPGRAQAYSRQGANAPWRLNMPIMNVVGNGGMLTTVGDWLKWNAMLDAKTFGEPFVQALETQGVLNDGRKIAYALGVSVGDYRGIKEVTHSGATAGYQTYLARFPERKLSVAVLCNGTPPSSGSIVYGIVNEIFNPVPRPPEVLFRMYTDEELKKYTGIWKNDVTRNINTIAVDKGKLTMNGTWMIAVGVDTFGLGVAKLKFKDGTPMTAEIANPDGSTNRLTQVVEWKPTAKELSEFAGEWYSEEAQAKASFVVENGKVFILNKPVIKLPLDPIYKDHFTGEGYVIWFTRNAKGKIERMHVGGGRMRDMFFERIRG